MSRVIATITKTTGNIVLVEEQEFVSENEEIKEILFEWGWVKPYDDTKPLPPKGVNKYEEKSYPAERFVTKDGNLLQSNQVTSSTYDALEWDVIIRGV